MEVGSVWREPLTSFLVRYPRETVEYLLKRGREDGSSRSLLLWLLKAEGGGPFRKFLREEPEMLTELLEGKWDPEGAEGKEMALSIIYILQKDHPPFLENNLPLLHLLVNIWKDPDFRWVLFGISITWLVRNE